MSDDIDQDVSGCWRGVASRIAGFLSLDVLQSYQVAGSGKNKTDPFSLSSVSDFFENSPASARLFKKTLPWECALENTTLLVTLTSR